MRDPQTRTQGPCSGRSVPFKPAPQIVTSTTLLGTKNTAGSRGGPGPTATVQRPVQTGRQGLRGSQDHISTHSLVCSADVSARVCGVGHRCSEEKSLQRTWTWQRGQSQRVRKLPHLWPLSAHRPALAKLDLLSWKESCFLLSLHAAPRLGQWDSPHHTV